MRDTPEDYGSRFERWDERAAVRVKPQPVMDPPAPDALYFPPELVPVLRHPLVAERGERAVHDALAQHLYHYLHFTVELEQLAIIPVAARIARGRSGLDLPERMRADAYKIVTDEAWHAQLSYDLIRQVEARSGVEWADAGTPAFLRRLDAVRRRLDPRVRGLERLLFAVVSETLISTVLTDIPRDRRLPGAVRDLVRDHAEDEGRHHAYFRDLLQRLWPALSAGERACVGPLLPAIVAAFVEPDREAAAVVARSAGLSREEARTVAAESLSVEWTARDTASRARTVVRYFEEAGALDDGATMEAFVSAGLLNNVRDG
ncbi:MULTISPECIES: diiron oxygenase [Streptosporangium]|uniref:Diiron oxygenase n=1 Tax=Streptosporangium jomthongense TaxID=1193683 RepID=A0ABV8EX28_9ACTN